MGAFEVSNDFVAGLYSNNGAVAAWSVYGKNWSRSASDIGKKWLHECDPDLEKKINDLDSKDKVKDFFANFKVMMDIDKACMDIISVLYSKVATYWDKDMGGVYNGMISNTASMIQATSAQNSATGDANAKASQSASQASTTAGQALTEAGRNLSDILSSGAGSQSGVGL